MEVTIPPEWMDRTIGEINIRKKYNINILALKKDGKLDMSITPDTQPVSYTHLDVYKRQVLQDEVGAAPHDDAGLFFCQFPDDPVLQLPKQVQMCIRDSCIGGRGRQTRQNMFSGWVVLIHKNHLPCPQYSTI